jgi:isocitrate dehydrogenase kinase/phosphatase
MVSDRLEEAPAVPLEEAAARSIASAFDRYLVAFEAVTRRGRARFERRDWAGAVSDAAERLDLYGTVLDEVVDAIRANLAEEARSPSRWAAIKSAFARVVAGRGDRELACTFFNSATRRILVTVGVDADVEFTGRDEVSSPPAGQASEAIRRRYSGGDEPGALVRRILEDDWFAAPFRDLDGDARLAGDRLSEALRLRGLTDPTGIDHVEMVRAPFFRRKGAYLVGRVVAGPVSTPLVLALLHEEDGIALDAVLADEDDVSILFGFTRSHFHLDVHPAAEVVQFLAALMPRKRVAELYIAIGSHKHGKTELYRSLRSHLASTAERFDLAPGTPGLVMVVFAMPGYDLVFKVIRDEFPASKTVTREGVMRQYWLVFRHDRAGRLVEAQEFEHLELDRTRFTPELLEELSRHATQTVAVEPHRVLLHHAYIERRVDPLDLYLRTVGEGPARDAAADFGHALRELAATNIFPGDLLPKNFGVTRHGRVVCYDYDELGLLTEFQFLAMPSAQDEDDELVEGGWFGAGPRDVFPEEFPRFISLPQPYRGEFEALHRDLYSPAFWQDLQSRIRGGEIVDIFPYHRSRRLREDG